MNPRMVPGNAEYEVELKKFIGAEVIVTDTTGMIHLGNCRGISGMHLNVIIATKTEKILIKNIVTIKRMRIKK